jgi:hypothetical protein
MKPSFDAHPGRAVKRTTPVATSREDWTGGQSGRAQQSPARLDLDDPCWCRIPNREGELELLGPDPNPRY